MKSHIILKILFIFFGIALIIFGFINSYFTSNLGINNRIFRFKDENGLKVSGFWEVPPFIIDGDESGWDIYQGSDAHNWTWATNQSWCSGMGTWNNPYIIENITINANYIESCIRIVDTSEYYIIRNVTVYNSGYWDAGIRLEWTENGEILNSNILNNRNGIIFNDNVHDLIISNNNITNNVHGIYFENYCEYNNISGNRIKNNEYGIRLFNSKYNIISNNLIINENINHGSQRTYGIYLHFSDYNNIFENNIIGTSKCIYEIDCVKNYINDNQCNPISSFNFGIFITTSLVIFFIVLLAITL
ncbi:MAG: NosD domain-containing protein, partial [Candidatus Thorarchaeota archaeon]